MAMPKEEVATPTLATSTLGKATVRWMTAFRSSWWTKPLQSSVPCLTRSPGIEGGRGLDDASVEPAAVGSADPDFYRLSGVRGCRRRLNVPRSERAVAAASDDGQGRKRQQRQRVENAVISDD